MVPGYTCFFLVFPFLNYDVTSLEGETLVISSVDLLGRWALQLSRFTQSVRCVRVFKEASSNIVVTL